MYKVFFFFISFFLSYLLGLNQLQAQNISKLIQKGITEGITVDLREPVYSDGVLTTTKGGVIQASRLRIQAKTIRYTRQTVEGETLLTVQAEEDLIIEFGDYIFIGDELFFDFQKQEGWIKNGKTTVEPWFFGGESIHLLPNGDYKVKNGYVTTSERTPPEWGIYSNSVTVKEEKLIDAEDVQIKLFNLPVFWIPSFHANVDSIFDSPIRYRFRWGGRQGPRFGFTYEVFSWERWKTFIRFDYRLTRGPGGGIETYYRSQDGKTKFESINYLAVDSSLLHPHDKSRFRFEGSFRKLMFQDKTLILLTYDKISDKDVTRNYYDRDFDFRVAERTQFLIRHQEAEWISNFYTRVRVNSFQTVKQQLPSLEVHFKPSPFYNTGILFDHWSSVSYLDFVYSKHLHDIHHYASSRFEYRPRLYRAFTIQNALTLTPEIGAVTILYDNGPHRDEQWLTLGHVGFDLNSQLYRLYGSYKHTITPYLRYHYYSAPTSSPHDHYIFDIQDGWTRLNYIRFGVKNSLYAKRLDYSISRSWASDFYAYAFFDTRKFRQRIPRIYASLVFFSTPTLRHTLKTAWNLEHGQVDHFNFRSEWTLHADFAISAEFRYRDAYSWRKVDEENFFLDVFRLDNQLRHSPLSDRRDTLLLHFFYRFHPNWACEFTSRQGWHRIKEPKYLEFELDLLTTIQTAWNLCISLQHKENDTRIAMYINVGLKQPKTTGNRSNLLCED
jgi:hypothetical protein